MALLGRLHNKQARGFTLIELSVTIAIMGILTVFVVVMFQQSERQRKLLLAAEQLKADFVYIRNLSLASRQVGGTRPFGGYGMQFTRGNAYTIFADQNRFPLEGGSLANAEQGTPNTIVSSGIQGGGNRWRGGTLIVVSGMCAGNKRVITQSTANSIVVFPNFSSTGTDCSPNPTTQFAILGNGAYDDGEKIQDRKFEGGVAITTLFPQEPLEIVFSPPEPWMKVNGSLATSASLTLSIGSSSRTINVNQRGQIEISQ